MPKLLIGTRNDNRDIPYNIVNLNKKDNVYYPIPKITYSGQEVYFNPITYMTTAGNIVLPYISYGYPETPLPRKIFKVDSSNKPIRLTGKVNNNTFSYSKSCRAILISTGSSTEPDSTSYLPENVTTYDGPCVYWAPQRADTSNSVYYGITFAKEGKLINNTHYPTKLTLSTSEYKGNTISSTDILDLSIPTTQYDNNTQVFRGVSATMSLLAPTSNPKDGIFLDILISYKINKKSSSTGDQYQFYAARAQVNSSGSLSWIRGYNSSPHIVSENTLNNSTTAGGIIRNFMLSQQNFIDVGDSGNLNITSNYRWYHLWS